MADKTAADILRGSGDDATKLKEVVGQKFTVVDFEEKYSSKYKSDFVIIEALTEDGDEVELMGGGHLASKLRKLSRQGFLPLDVVVVSFETDKGDGYGLDIAE